MKRTIDLRISGMHCGNCVAKVARALTGVEGVEVESLAIGSARVQVPSDGTNPQDVADAVTRAGYPAQLEPAS